MNNSHSRIDTNTDAVALGDALRAVALAIAPLLAQAIAPLLAAESDRLAKARESAGTRRLSLAMGRQLARVSAETFSLAVNLDPGHEGYLPSEIIGGPKGGGRGPRRHVRQADIDAWLARGGAVHAAEAARARRIRVAS